MSGDEPRTEPVTGTATEPRRGLPTESTLFYGLGAFTALIGTVYAVTTTVVGDFEPAGTFSLFGVSAFGAYFGTFLLLSVRRIQGDVEALEEAHAAGDADADDVLYLPTTSVWPIGLAVGLSLVLAGVPMGLWVMIPGVALLGHSLVGFIRQTRTRS